MWDTSQHLLQFTTIWVLFFFPFKLLIHDIFQIYGEVFGGEKWQRARLERLQRIQTEGGQCRYVRLSVKMNNLWHWPSFYLPTSVICKRRRFS